MLAGIWRVCGSNWLQNLAVRSICFFNSTPRGNKLVGVHNLATLGYAYKFATTRCHFVIETKGTFCITCFLSTPSFLEAGPVSLLGGALASLLIREPFLSARSWTWLALTFVSSHSWQYDAVLKLCEHCAGSRQSVAHFLAPFLLLLSYPRRQVQLLYKEKKERLRSPDLAACMEERSPVLKGRAPPPRTRGRARKEEPGTS
eukprot:1154305-Pelagomonas_calceolata.AAC.12